MSAVFVRRFYRCLSCKGQFSTLAIFSKRAADIPWPARCPYCPDVALYPFDEQLALTPELALEFLERAAAVAKTRVSE